MDLLYTCQSLPVFHRIKSGGPIDHPAVDTRISWTQVNMVSKTCVCILVCLGLMAATQSFVPKALAKPDMDAYMVDALRSDSRDYVVGVDYPPVDYGPQPRRRATLPKFIVDYANMIRDDITLLDNSIETRSRNRGNVKVKKDSNHGACSCQLTYENKPNNYVTLSDVLGMAKWYPQQLLNFTCDQSRCAKPYRCQEVIYNVPVLKGSNSDNERTLAGDLYKTMPNNLQYAWVPQMVPVVAGCLCTTDNLDN